MHDQITADQQDEINLWKLQLKPVEAEIWCKTYTKTVKIKCTQHVHGWKNVTTCITCC